MRASRNTRPRAADLVDDSVEWPQVRYPHRAVDLQHVRVGVPIEDETGEAVVLAVEDSVAVRVARFVAERPATLDGRGESLLPEVGIDRRRLAVMQDADPDR